MGTPPLPAPSPDEKRGRLETVASFRKTPSLATPGIDAIQNYTGSVVARVTKGRAGCGRTEADCEKSAIRTCSLPSARGGVAAQRRLTKTDATTTKIKLSNGVIVEKSWEYAQPVYMCFVDREKAYDRIPRHSLWTCLRAYGIDDKLLGAIQSLYSDSRCCVSVNGVKSKPFNVRTGHRQGCVLSPILFVLYMSRIARHCQGDEGIASSETDLQCSLERLAAECVVTGMRVNAYKMNGLVLSRFPARCCIQINGEAVEQVEKFKYLGSVFTSDGKLEEEIDLRIRVGSGVLRELARTTVTKAELSLETELSIFKSIFIAILT
ncbi:unnamed protein product [Soboliphyme baturini]|uniref:Reverse transcriptase domain-containing protein n=1 Tax=Soboliphyme baturini TaxID=241478 RepID=A0A183IK79_9BILA|nr:unnamed protein product [Soboliphyme baturini]